MSLFIDADVLDHIVETMLSPADIAALALVSRDVSARVMHRVVGIGHSPMAYVVEHGLIDQLKWLLDSGCTPSRSDIWSAMCPVREDEILSTLMARIDVRAEYWQVDGLFMPLAKAIDIRSESAMRRVVDAMVASKLAGSEIWTRRQCHALVRVGSADMLAWARMNGLRIDDRRTRQRYQAMAASHGNKAIFDALYWSPVSIMDLYDTDSHINAGHCSDEDEEEDEDDDHDMVIVTTAAVGGHASFIIDFVERWRDVKGVDSVLTRIDLYNAALRSAWTTRVMHCVLDLIPYARITRSLHTYMSIWASMYGHVAVVARLQDIRMGVDDDRPIYRQ